MLCYVVGTTDNTNKTCVGSIYSVDGIPNNLLIVGDTFMKNVYTVFDMAKFRVGFATPA